MGKRVEINAARVLELGGLIERGLTTEQACHYLRMSPGMVNRRVNHPEGPEDENLQVEILRARAADLLRVHDILMERNPKRDVKTGEPKRLETAQVKAALGRLYGLDARFKPHALATGGQVIVYITVPRPGGEVLEGGGIEIVQGTTIEEGAAKRLAGGSAED